MPKSNTPTPTSVKKATKVATSAGYLPVLPDGWQYGTIQIAANEFTGGHVTVRPAGLAENPHRHVIETVLSSSEGTRLAYADTLPDALRVAAKGVKALDAVERQEREIREARQEALLTFGEVAPEAMSAETA